MAVEGDKDILPDLPSFTEDWETHKCQSIMEAIDSDPVKISSLRGEAITKGGLLCNELRRKAWTKLLGINIYNIPSCPHLDHKDRNQVILDVNRCGRRLPKELSIERINSIQDSLIRVLLRLLVTHTDLCYYQGLHDVVLTFLLLPLNEDITFAIMNVLVQYHIRDFLDPDIGRTKEIMSYIRPLLRIHDSQLESFITRSECEYYFSLSWILTWYSHVVYDREDLLMLTDLFLASHPLMPIYVATVLINSRRSEVLEQDCEMSSIHGFLSKFPEEFDVNELVHNSVELFNKIPPHKIASTGNIRLNSSLMIRTHNEFLKTIKGQRPDSLLSRQPDAPRLIGWAEHARDVSMNVIWFSLPIIVGVFLIWFDGSILSINN